MSGLKHAASAGVVAAVVGCVGVPMGALAQENLGKLEVVATGLTRPLYMESPPGEPERMMIVQQNGIIRVLENGVLLPDPFLDITNLTSASGERGLLGLAFDPDYADTRRFYINYTTLGSPFFTRIARYTTSGNPNVANPDGEVILQIQQDFTNHNGGCVKFGPDGMLYIGMGDGGSGNDPLNRGQDPQSLLGKMLRIDVDVPSGYEVPGDNPFVGAPGTLDEIWAIGLRNPWRFSFDRQEGDLYIADVGQNWVEEINYAPAPDAGGQNYGWRCMEGTRCTGLSGCTCNDPALTLPVHEYWHPSFTAARSITGGYVYRGDAIPRWRGRYFYADFITNQVWSIRVVGGVATDEQEHTAHLPSDSVPSYSSVGSFAEDADGEMYILSLFGGAVYRIDARFHPADWNLDGVVDSDDLFDFLQDWADGDADFNGDNVTDSDDLFDFLAAWGSA